MFHPLCFDGDGDRNEANYTCLTGSVKEAWSDFVSPGFDLVGRFPEELFVEMIELFKCPAGGSKTAAVNKIPGRTIALSIRTRCSKVVDTRVAVRRRRCAFLMWRAQLILRNFPVPT